MKNHTSAAARFWAFLLVGLMPLLAAAGVPPVHLTNIVLQKYGEESKSIIFQDGQLFWDSENDTLFIGDGVTPGGKACCPHFGKHYEIDYHTFTNTLHVHGNDIEYNAFWSQVGEGGSMLYRFGTNSFLRFVGARQGTLANLAVDAYDPNAGTMTLTADATNAPLLQVATNLLEVDPWRDATNATLLGVTDASTSWHIALLGTSFETYRCLASVDREEGIYAEKTFYADDGVSMAGEKWERWPDLSQISSNSLAISNLQVLASANYDCIVTNAANIATNAASIASVVRRLDRLEMPETCVLWWSTNLTSGTTNWVPTNFPTRKLEIRIDRSGLTNVYTHVNGAFDYGREVEITIVTFASSGDGHGVIRVVGKQSNSMGNIAGVNTRIYTFQFDPATKAMRTMCMTPSVAGDKLATVAFADGQSNGIPTGPCTVEEWLALWQERNGQTTPQE